MDPHPAIHWKLRLSLRTGVQRRAETPKMEPHLTGGVWRPYQTKEVNKDPKIKSFFVTEFNNYLRGMPVEAKVLTGISQTVCLDPKHP